MVRSQIVPRLGSRPDCTLLKSSCQRVDRLHCAGEHFSAEVRKKVLLIDVDFERCLHLAQTPPWVYDSVSF